VAGGQISPSPIDFHRRPYNTLALPCERVIADPLWSCVMLLCGLLRYLVIPSTGTRVQTLLYIMQPQKVADTRERPPALPRQSGRHISFGFLHT